MPECKPLRALLIAALVGLPAATPAFAAEDDPPPEYRDRPEAREAYRRGYQRGFERGYRRGLEERVKPAAPASVPAPAPAPAPAKSAPRKKAVPTGPIRVTAASYGSLSQRCDATSHVADRADGKRSYSFQVTNAMCGDPAEGERKQLEVTYHCGDMVKTSTARQQQTIFLSCIP
jgi:hypothetical protein